MTPPHLQTVIANVRTHWERSKGKSMTQIVPFVIDSLSQPTCCFDHWTAAAPCINVTRMSRLVDILLPITFVACQADLVKETDWKYPAMILNTFFLCGLVSYCLLLPSRSSQRSTLCIHSRVSSVIRDFSVFCRTECITYRRRYLSQLHLK